MDTEKIEGLVYELLKAIGENPDREGLLETPKRVAQMMVEMYEGIQYSNADIADMFGKTFTVDTNQMVVVKDISCFSYCEHHMALMYDMNISVGYIPKGKVIGLSKIPRIAEMCCKRLQLQEKIGEDISEVISLATGSEDVIVHITSSHSCMSARGIKSTDSKTTTLATKGAFGDDAMIQRFMLMKQS
ncbi:GTP cyclohydrolase I [Veillonella agrestimuris]|uniref:GTP cyclohydrolase I n=1 Tax=Veillonella agrestimuris TaxID=2941340 RepID=UPI00203C9B08|nr:GTP cyclohydrolase I [Veillonella agrestimuris]